MSRIPSSPKIVNPKPRIPSPNPRSQDHTEKKKKNVGWALAPGGRRLGRARRARASFCSLGLRDFGYPNDGKSNGKENGQRCEQLGLQFVAVSVFGLEVPGF